VDTIARDWHTTAEQQHADELSKLRARLAAAEARAAAAAASEARTARAAHALLIEHVIEPSIPADYPEMSGPSAEGIAAALMDDLLGGTEACDLDPSGHIEAWAEAVR
jgi:hypothetical protein